MSGISVTSLSFRTTADLELVGMAAAVTLGGISGLPTFYIDRRSMQDGIWTVECLDLCAFLDTPINTSGWQISGGRYQISAVIGGLTALGFSSVELPYSSSAYIPCSAVDGKTYQALLQEMSEAFGGYFCVTQGTWLNFVLWNAVISNDEAEEWSVIHRNGSFAYGKVILTNNGVSVSLGNGDFPLEISNELVDTGSAGSYQALVGSSFTGWSVDSYISAYVTLPAIGGTVKFDTEYLRVTRVEAHVAGNKLILSAGGDIPQYGEINRKGLLQRRLDDMVSTTKVYNNLKVTPYPGLVAVPNPAQNP